MNAATKLVVFALWLVVVFGAGLALGTAVGPIDTGDAEHHGAME